MRIAKIRPQPPARQIPRRRKLGVRHGVGSLLLKYLATGSYPGLLATERLRILF